MHEIATSVQSETSAPLDTKFGIWVKLSRREDVEDGSTTAHVTLTSLCIKMMVIIQDEKQVKYSNNFSVNLRYYEVFCREILRCFVTLSFLALDQRSVEHLAIPHEHCVCPFTTPTTNAA